MIDGGTRNLSGLSNLLELDLSWCSNLTDEQLTHLPPSITKLKLKDCKNLTDQGIENLVNRCPNLEYLDISFCRNVSASAFTKLLELTLQELVLQGCQGSLIMIAELKGMGTEVSAS